MPTVDSLPRSRFPSEPVHAAVMSWQRTRAADLLAGGKRAGHALELVDSEGGSNHRIVVREEIRSGAACAATLRVLLVPMGKPRADEHDAPVQDKLLGDDCCADDACPRRPGIAWLIRLQKRILEGDLAGVRQLVAPERGLRVVSVCSGEGCVEPGEDVTMLTRQSLTLAAFSTSHLELGSDTVTCEELEGSKFTCFAHGGGYEGHFDWVRAGERAYLVELFTHGH